jgi:kynureninase
VTSFDETGARALDAADPLARFRERFSVPDPDLVYLDGNSLGRPPIAALERVAGLGDRWATDLIRGWYGPDGWLDLPLRVGDLLASSVLGARPGEVVVGDSTTVNLYRVASAALGLAAPRRSIAIARSEFPTDRYVVEGLATERGLSIRWLEPDPVEGVAVDDIGAVLHDDLALIVLSLVDYRSAAFADMASITRLARDAGALVLWDLSHAAGAVPIELAAVGADLAVGCTYKYLNGGPGAPAFLYVRREMQDRLRPPIQGWFGQLDQFEMGPLFERRAGIAGWLVGTPWVAGLVAIEAAVELIAEAGIGAIRSKGVALTDYAVELFDAWLAPLGCELGSPRDPARRGSHVAVRHPAATSLVASLMEHGVVVDFREPDVIRIGLSPLTTTFADVHRGLAVLRDLMG